MEYDRGTVSRSMLRGCRGMLGIGFSLLLSASGAQAYQEVPVTDGGRLTGTVKLTGGKPVPRGFNLVTFPDPIYCGRISNGAGWRLLKEFIVGEGNGVKDVVVMLTGIEKGKPFSFKESRIEAIDCQFKPFVAVVKDHGKIEVVNMDPVMHDIQAYETSELGPRVLFNRPMPMNPHHPKTAGASAEYHRHIAGEPMVQEISMTKGRRVFVMQCGFHAYMESWGLAVDNPYFARTDPSGRFEIGDIPPGTYKMVVWHPQARQTIEQEVTIQAKGSASVNIEVQPREGARAGMDTVDNPRFNLGTLGLQEIKATLELQQP